MNKIYSNEKEAQIRIETITIESNSSSPSYKDTFCSSKYRMATFVGCMLSAF